MSKKRKIAVVAAVDGTLKGLLLAQIKAAQAAGYEVWGVCTKGENFEYLESEGIKMHPVTIKRKISPFSDLVVFWKLYRFFGKEKIDIVHTHTPKVSLFGQLAAKLAQVPIIIHTVHGFYFHENMPALKRWFYIAAEWIAGKCSTITLSQNLEDIDTAIKLGICKPQKIELLGNGVNLSRFEPKRFDDNFIKEKRKEIGIPEDAIVIGIIGRLVKEKGFLELFKAMKNIMTKNEKVWFIIIGSEEPEKSDRISSDTFREYGIAERTSWLGRCEDIPELLSCFDIYTLPSWREGFPRSAIEAACMAKPIVATNIRGCRQVVEDGKNGFLVPFRDVEKLSEALTKLIEDEALRKRMGKAGFEKSRREFDERDVCKIVLDTYNECISAVKIGRKI